MPPSAASNATRAARSRGAGVAALRVPLLRVDDELRRAVPASQLPVAERSLVVPGYRLEAGPWDPADLVGDGPPPMAALVLHGLITMDIGLAGCASAHLWGPGTLVRPWHALSDVLPAPARWTVSADGATIGVLDDSFAQAERRWPALATCVRDRFADQADAQAVRTAIAGLPRVEQRVLALFWHLAERWGTVTADGVFVHLKLTHEFIGRMVGAKRPTVSLALALLAEDGALESADDKGWRLSPASASTLDGPLKSHSASATPVALRMRAPVQAPPA